MEKRRWKDIKITSEMMSRNNTNTFSNKKVNTSQVVITTFDLQKNYQFGIKDVHFMTATTWYPFLGEYIEYFIWETCMNFITVSTVMQENG